jgi:hypothetical protein
MTKQALNAKTKAAAPKPPRTKSLHDIKDCRVVEIGIDGFAECVQWGPASCDHALPFGYCFLCMHPRLNVIIENTKKAQLAGKV